MVTASLKLGMKTWVKWMKKDRHINRKARVRWTVSTLMETHYWKTRTLAHLLCRVWVEELVSVREHSQLISIHWSCSCYFMSIYACTRGKFCHSEPDWRRFWHFPMGLGCWFLTWLYPRQKCTCTQVLFTPYTLTRDCTGFPHMNRSIAGKC